jgi:dTDP-glucose pyrophosphorylase
VKDGIAAGLRIATPDLRGHNIALILGDNIFFGAGLADTLETSMANNTGATIFGCEVANPRAFGVVTLDATGHPTAIEEKPANPKSRIAVTGLYMYAADVLEVAAQVGPSACAELEITDVNRVYLKQSRLRVHKLGRGVAWLDGGTPGDLYEANQFVKVIQDRTGLRGCLPRRDRISSRLHRPDGARAVSSMRSGIGLRGLSVARTGRPADAAALDLVRWEYHAHNFLGFVQLACLVILFKQ